MDEDEELEDEEEHRSGAIRPQWSKRPQRANLHPAWLFGAAVGAALFLLWRGRRCLSGRKTGTRRSSTNHNPRSTSHSSAAAGGKPCEGPSSSYSQAGRKSPQQAVPPSPGTSDGAAGTATAAAMAASASGRDARAGGGGDFAAGRAALRDQLARAAEARFAAATRAAGWSAPTQPGAVAGSSSSPAASPSSGPAGTLPSSAFPALDQRREKRESSGHGHDASPFVDTTSAAAPSPRARTRRTHASPSRPMWVAEEAPADVALLTPYGQVLGLRREIDDLELRIRNFTPQPQESSSVQQQQQQQQDGDGRRRQEPDQLVPIVGDGKARDMEEESAGASLVAALDGAELALESIEPSESVGPIRREQRLRLQNLRKDLFRVLWPGK